MLKNAALELHSIPYPENHPAHSDEYDAGFFRNSLDHYDSRYYAINDYYNMKSDSTMHLISGFKTYQQTAKFPCGCAAALMVLHHFGVIESGEMR